MKSPSAYFDALFLGNRLTTLVRGFSQSELHLLSYAGCLMSLYQGEPTSDWEYEFTSSPAGLPFALDLEEALVDCRRMGHITEHGDLLRLTETGKYELEFCKELSMNQRREVFLEGAADCLLVYTPGAVREAFEYEPVLAFLKNRSSSAWILNDPTIDRLHNTFAEIRELLSYQGHDLSLPLLAWLDYLLLTGREHEHHNSDN